MNPIKRFFEIYTEAQETAGGVVPSRIDIGPDQLNDVLRRNMTVVNCFDHYEPKDKPAYRAFYSAITGMTCGGYKRRRVMLDKGET